MRKFAPRLNKNCHDHDTWRVRVFLGGAAVVLCSVRQEFDALILEAVYPTIKQAVANRLRMRFGTRAVSGFPPCSPGNYDGGSI